MIGPINGDISMAPIITAVELTLRPKEAKRIAAIRIQIVAPFISTPSRMDLTASLSSDLSRRTSKYSSMKDLKTNTLFSV